VVNLHTSDRALGDTPEITLMAQLHIAGAGLIVAVALVTVWHRRRAEQGRPAPHPHWALLVSLLVVFVAVIAPGSYRVSGWSVWKGAGRRAERLGVGPPASIGAAHAAFGEPVVAD
jgi:hypothetical protein